MIEILGFVTAQIVIFFAFYVIAKIADISTNRVVMILPLLFLLCGIAILIEGKQFINFIEYFSITQGLLIGARK